MNKAIRERGLGMMEYLKSRNTLVATAIFFIIIVLVLKFASGFFESNVERVMGAILGGKAESIPLIDFGSIDLSWLNPANWSTEGIRDAINEKAHEIVDSILPAVIHMANLAVIQFAVVLRAEAISPILKTTGMIKVVT